MELGHFISAGALGIGDLSQPKLRALPVNILNHWAGMLYFAALHGYKSHLF
jgi:hypothetical protein